jgi:hypothetical protein
VVRLKERGGARGDYRRSGLTVAVDSKTAMSVTLQWERGWTSGRRASCGGWWLASHTLG